MKVFLVVIPSISYGERQHAIGVINQLKNTSFEPVLLFEPLLEDTFKSIDVKKYVFYNSYDFQILYKKENPDMFIFFEYTNCPEKIKEFVANTDKPILTTLGSGVGGIESYKQHYPNLDKNGYFNLTVIKPCPVASPDKDTDNVKHWNLFKNLDKSKYDKNLIIKKFNIDENSKIIFLSVATWICDRMKNLNMLSFYDYLLALIFNALKDQKFKSHLFIISPFGEKIIERENIKVTMMNFIDYETYDNLLMNSDLVISENVMQASMSKAFVAGIKCLALINTKLIDRPFKMEPYDVLSVGKMYDDSNKYYKALDKVEISDLEELTNKLSNIFDDTKNLEREIYLEYINKLPSIEKILSDKLSEYKSKQG